MTQFKERRKTVTDATTRFATQIFGTTHALLVTIDCGRDMPDVRQAIAEAHACGVQGIVFLLRGIGRRGVAKTTQAQHVFDCARIARAANPHWWIGVFFQGLTLPEALRVVDLTTVARLCCEQRLVDGVLCDEFLRAADHEPMQDLNRTTRIMMRARFGRDCLFVQVLRRDDAARKLDALAVTATSLYGRERPDVFVAPAYLEDAIQRLAVPKRVGELTGNDRPLWVDQVHRSNVRLCASHAVLVVDPVEGDELAEIVRIAREVQA